MKVKSTIAALLLMVVAGVQTTWAQGFRVYKSDGTVAQFSFRTDSIVFYEDIGTDTDFGPFTPVNQCIAGTWYKSASDPLTFDADGTTNYMEGATYKFLPYQGTIVIYNAGKSPTSILKVHDLTADQMILSVLGNDDFSVLTRTIPSNPVTRITLTPKTLTMLRGKSASLMATALPVSADNKELKWSSSNPRIVTVTASDRYADVKAVEVGSCVIICSATDGSGVYAECPVTVQDSNEYVDLGLPSGTLWATCNVGADSPEKLGNSFAWGETEPKEDYLWDNYRHCMGSETTLTKYCWYSSNGYNGFTDNKKELDPEDDAATANWGSNWQMPSQEQMEELIYGGYVEILWTVLNGVNGMLFTSYSNGKSIFLPAGGFRSSEGIDNGESSNGSSDGISGNVNVAGDYWSRSIDLNNNYEPYYRYFCSDYRFGQSLYQRYYGRNIRPVRKQ